MQFKHILVVCVGNICRSPMAEYLFKQALPERQIHSAGIAAMIGYPADEKAQRCMQSIGLDMQAHRAKKLTGDMIKQADLVLVMSKNQQQHLEQHWPFAKGKTFRLGHWQSKNIADPYQQDQLFFDHTFEQIQQCVNDWTSHL